MKKMILFVLILSAGASAQFWQELTVEDFTLRWATVSETELSVELSASTTGWVAVGFDNTMAMQDANIIIGYVLSGTPSIRDDFGVAPNSHAADTLLGGSHDLTIDGGTESGGVTEIQFTIPLDSGDQYDKALAGGSTYSIILARSADGMDNFVAPHALAVTAEIDILALALDQSTWGGMKGLMAE